MTKKSWEIIVTHEREELETAGYTPKITDRELLTSSDKDGIHAHSEFSALENLRIKALERGANAVLLNEGEPRLFPGGTCWYAEGIPYY
jgi:hypothetical protein